MKNESFFVYALISRSHDRIYVGMSEDVERRLKEHNSGKVSSTKHYLPWERFYSEFAGDTSCARDLEKYYKSAAGKRKLRKILESLDSGSLPD
jgi:putative endonuclease